MEHGWWDTKLGLSGLDKKSPFTLSPLPRHVEGLKTAIFFVPC